MRWVDSGSGSCIRLRNEAARAMDDVARPIPRSSETEDLSASM
jgi:hypothetical protein